MIVLGDTPLFPAFLGIGVQKAGTTWLHAMLSTHDEIWLPHLKELHYFDRKFPIRRSDQGPTTQPRRGILGRQLKSRMARINARKVRERLSFRRWSDVTWEFRYLFGEWNDEWYASLFTTASGRMAGEITPAYACLGESAISHIHRIMPDAKLILLLRDPVDRAWSHARMDLGRTAQHDAVQIESSEYIAHFNGYSSRIRGNYLQSIRQWLACYDTRQLFIGFYDEILSDPEELLLRIFRFLGVSATKGDIPVQVHTRINAGRQAAIPPHLHKHLAALYVEDLRTLAAQYGAHPQRWLEKCDSILHSGQNT